MNRFPLIASLLLTLTVMVLGENVHAAKSNSAATTDIDDLLSPAEAFKLQAQPRIDRVRLNFEIAKGYYLYRDRVSVKAVGTSPELIIGNLLKPSGVVINDPLFGNVETFRDRISIDVPLESIPADGVVHLAVTSQGCADLGVCYPPQTQQLQIAMNSAASSSSSSPVVENEFSRLGQLFGSETNTGETTEFPHPDEVFHVNALALDANTLQVRFEISEGYYLYRKRMKFSLEGHNEKQLTDIALPKGKSKNDPFFGQMQVFTQGVDVQIPLATKQSGIVQLKVGYQGCAEAGLCYPPQSKVLNVSFSDVGKYTQSKGLSSSTVIDELQQGQLSQTDLLAQGLVQGSLLLVLASFFGWGLLLAFTPCVLPMVPILASIITGQGEQLGSKRGFTLSLVYVLAMASTYTAAGITAALLGHNLQALFQHPAVLILFSSVFVGLSLAMFGLYELQLPSSWQTRLQQLSQSNRSGRYGGVAVMGSLSALIVGPCVAAPLAAALIVIGGSGDPVRGGLALFALSIGMGTPLLAVGAFGDRIMPRLGPWMILVKQLFGVMLLAVAIYLLSRILPAVVIMGLWSALLVLTAALFALGGVTSMSGHVGILRMRQGLGAMALLYASLLAVGAASGANDPLNPLAKVFGEQHQGLKFKRVNNLSELETILAQAKRDGQSVMLDFYADWCVTCKQMEAQTFTDPGVQAALGNTILLQADVTDYNEQHKALLSHFNLLGPPAILFFNINSEEVQAQRVIGFVGIADFKQTVNQALGS